MSQDTNTDTNAIDAGWEGKPEDAAMEGAEHYSEGLKAEKAAHAKTKERLEAAEASNKVFVDRATDSGGTEWLSAGLRDAIDLLRRWRLHAVTDHRLPRDTFELLERLGALE
jgi:hypothetical protein